MMKKEATCKIGDGVLTWVKDRALDAGRSECMGLLGASASVMDGPIVTGACLLTAIASGSHAVADPLALREGAARLRARNLRAIGLWHSHGAHAVFHSETDDGTIERLLPAMAEANFQRPRSPWLAPIVTGPDQAVLPLADGQVLHFALLGAALVGAEGHELAMWTSVVTAFRRECEFPRALQDDGVLHLEGGGVVLALGVPVGASITSRRLDAASVRTATLYSLVVNNRGDTYAESLTVHDLDGEQYMQRETCAIEIVPAASARMNPATMFVYNDCILAPTSPARAASLLPTA